MINGGVGDFFDQAERVIRGAGRIKNAYKDVTKVEPVEAAQVTYPAIELDRNLKLFLGAGAIALIGWIMLVKK